jgi:hypothetical protein
MAITELVGEKKYREPFSDASPLPKEYQDIAKKGVFIKIFTYLFIYNINFCKYISIF